MAQETANPGQEIAPNPPDFYIARGQTGFGIGIQKVEDKFGQFHVYTQDENGRTTLSDPFEKGKSEAEIDQRIEAYLNELKSKGFSIKEHFKPQGQQTEDPDNTERGQRTNPQTEKTEDKKGPEVREQTPENRSNAQEPESEYGGGTFLEDVENWIPSLFAGAHQGVGSLKAELESDVDESNWIGKAIGATVLDVLDTSMAFAEGIPLGLLDTRRFGEGLAEGTWEGAKKDISRALNVIPQGKILRAADRAITASNVVESMQNEDTKGAAMNAGMGAMAIATKGKVKKQNRYEPASQHLDSEQLKVVDHLQKNVFSQKRIELISKFSKGEPGVVNTESAASTALHTRAKTDLESKFKSKVKVEENVLLRPNKPNGKPYGKQNIDLQVSFPGKSTPDAKVELKARAWLDGGKLKTPWTVNGKNKSQVKQLAAIQRSAKKNPTVPHLVVTPKQTFKFDVKTKEWVTLNLGK